MSARLPLSGEGLASAAGPILKAVLEDENRVLGRLEVLEKLKRYLNTPSQMKTFAIDFYYIRYDFYRHNFLVGSRCDVDETYWSGLVLNLFEELGGDGGKTHNQLYREYLQSVGVESEPTGPEPVFAREFNAVWEHQVRHAPLLESVCSIAIYEILDRPDYALLLQVMKACGVPRKGQVFFEVHASAEHFEFFEDMMEKVGGLPGGGQHVENAKEFVLSTQERMWRRLIDRLAKRATMERKEVPC